jgi:hypothetical protein
LGGPQSQSGHGGKEKNSRPLPGFKPPVAPYENLARFQSKGREGGHEVSNDNGVRVANFVTSKKLIVKSTTLPHCTFINTFGMMVSNT